MRNLLIAMLKSDRKASVCDLLGPNHSEAFYGGGLSVAETFVPQREDGVRLIVQAVSVDDFV